MASYKKLKKGWRYRINIIDNSGERRQFTKSGFRTKSEAVNAATELEQQKKVQQFITAKENPWNTLRVGIKPLGKGKKLS